ncbi:MAG: hypothetical protein ACRDBG_25355 [Waterburya sp.]
MNKSFSFVSQMFRLSEHGLNSSEAGFVDTYLMGIHPEAGFSGRLYILYKETPKIERVLSIAKEHERFDTFFCVGKHHVVVALKYSEEEIEKIVKPFMLGKYSRVDREYVDKYFPLIRSHALYDNRRVFDRCPAIKAYWEGAILMVLPSDAEVWSKMKTENETIQLV